MPGLTSPHPPAPAMTEWFPTQAPALTQFIDAYRVGTGATLCVLADDVNEDGAKRYASMAAPPRGILPAGNKYEIAPIMRRRHVLLDVDFLVSSAPDLTPDVILAKLRENVEAIHGTGPLDVQISAASGAYKESFKHSFHVVFPGTCVTFHDQNAFVKILEERLKPLNWPAGVPDFSIYTNNRCMRMLYQNKLGSERVLLPYGNSSADAYDHLWCIYKNRDDVTLTWTDPNPPPVVQAPLHVYPAELSRDFTHKVESMVDCLNVQRATDYMPWLKVGAALYHVGEDVGDCNAFFHVWDAWSDKANNYVPGACEAKWRTFSRPSDGTKVAMGSLRRWAKEDDPQAYADIVAEERDVEEATPEAITAFFASLNVATTPTASNVSDVADIAVDVPHRGDATLEDMVPVVPSIPDEVWGWKPSGRDAYAVVKAKFELYNFKIAQHGVFGRFNRGSGVPTFNTEAQMTIIYKDWFYLESDKPFIKRWISDINKRSYETMDFLPPPLQAPAHVFNTFYGFRAAQLECAASDDMTVILEFIDIMAGRDATSAKYLLDWLAVNVQRPAIKGDATYIMLHGEQGIGKSLLVEFFGNKIIGPNYYKKPRNIADTLFGRFADAAENTIVLFLEECKGLHKYNEDIKDLVTGDTLQIEHKGQMPRMIRNAMRFIIATNNEHIVKVEASDRRGIIITASSEKLGDVAYFDNVAEWMEQESNQRGFYDFLVKRDISDVRFQRDRPKTAAYMNAKLDSMPLITKWLVAQCKEAEHEDETVVKQIRMETFRNWAKVNGARDTTFSDNIISRELKKLGVEMGDNVRVDGRMAYHFVWAAVKAKLVSVTRLDADVLFVD